MPEITDQEPRGIDDEALLKWIEGQRTDACRIRDRLNDVIASLNSLEEATREANSNAHKD